MFSVIEPDTRQPALSHPEFSPLLVSIKESLATMAINKGEKLPTVKELASLVTSQRLVLANDKKMLQALEDFKTARGALYKLALTPDVYKAVHEAIQDTENKLATLNQQSEAINSDIEACKKALTANEESHVSALARGDFDGMAELESRAAGLAQSLKIFEGKRKASNESTPFMLNSLLSVLKETEKALISQYRKKRVNELMPAFEKAQAEFLKACQVIAAYDVSVLVTVDKYLPYSIHAQPRDTVTWGKLWDGLEKAVIETDYPTADLKAELLRAA
jgi:DNA-binding transcriptional regulator YhcF (GntR family)